MRRYLILFLVLMTTIYIKSRKLESISGKKREQTIEQLQKEINELKKSQDNYWMVLSNEPLITFKTQK